MSKETFYFSHDYNTRSDEKIKKLIRVHGMKGYGVFWALVEDLYNNANALRTDYDSIAYDLREDVSVVKSIINDFDLFSIEADFFGSQSIERRLDKRNEKSLKARESAFKRWNKNAIASGNECERNAIASKTDAIKESIVKDNKGKNIKPKGEIFDFLDQIIQTYSEVDKDYIIIDRVKERTYADKLLIIWKGKYPETSEEETIVGLREYFEKCISVNDSWLREKMNLRISLEEMSRISKNLQNGNAGKKQAGASQEGLARVIAKHFTIDDANSYQ